MSGGTIGGVLGGIVGFYLGGPTGAAWGYSIGAAIGGYVDPAPGPHTFGPRLSDLHATSADYGADIPRIVGRGRVAGRLIYCQEAQEHSHTQSSGGKGGGGGGSVTTYTYTRTFAVALCEGEAAVLRVWVGGKLIYDVSNADPATLMAQVTGNDVVTIYPGSETQMPDASLAAAMGAGGAPAPVAVGAYQTTGSAPGSGVLLPAYRGTCYLVFPDYDVTAYGGYTPPVEAEVVSQGLGLSTITTVHGPYVGGSASAVYYGLQGVLAGGITMWSGASLYNNNFVGGYSLRLGDTLLRDTHLTPTDPSGVQFTRGVGLGNSAYAICSHSPGSFYLLNLSTGESTEIARQPNPAIGWVVPDGYAYLVGNVAFFATGNGVAFASAELNGGRLTERATASISSVSGNQIAGTWVDGRPVLLNFDGGVTTVYDADLVAIATISGMPQYWQYGYLREGYLTSSYQQLVESQYDGSGWTQTWVGPATSAAVVNVFVVERQRKIIYWTGGGTTAIQYWVYNADGTISTSDATAEQIILALCAEGGLASTDVDASACAGITLPGYARTKVTTPRTALGPLLQAWQIDAVESGDVIKFVPRGQGTTITVDPLDLGAYDAGATPPNELQSTRTQAAELPRQVTIAYQDTARADQLGSQTVRRLDAPDSGVVSVQFPGLLTPDQAAQRADVLLRVAWRERMQRALSLPHAYLRVEPGDILSWSGYQIRITRTDGIVPGTIKLQGVDENPADYSSAATGMTVAGASALAVSGPTDLLVLDMPALRDEDAQTPGVYLAACGYLSGWKGCALQRSPDSGTSWTQIGMIGLPGVIGQAVDALGVGLSTVVDRGNSVTVRMYYGGGSIASITDLELFNGVNTLILGSEIIGFRDAALNADGTYTLSHLLRGRYGTEDAIGTHAAGERVFLVTAQGWVRQVESVANLGQTLEYRAPSAGQYGEQADAIAITYSARSAKPWSPVHLKARRVSSGDITFTWVRRTRMQTSFEAGTAPLGEDSELYDVEVINGSGAVVRTFSALTSATVTYTAAQQTTDFGSAQSSVNLRIYQISAAVGRGIPLEAAA